MSWLVTLGFSRPAPDVILDRERVRERLLDQERRLEALSRAVEVIQHSLSEDQRDDP